MSESLVRWVDSIMGACTPAEQRLLGRAHQFFSDGANSESPTKQVAHFHDKQKQKSLGIAYTPAPIRDELTANVLNQLQQSMNISEVRLCDPCCGSGLFVTTFLDHFERHGITPQDALSHNIYFADVDRDSVLVTLTNLYVYLCNKGIVATTTRPHVAVADFFSETRKFDAYVTNPPYVKLQNLSTDLRESLKRQFPNLFVGSSGLSGMFLKHMLDTLSPMGILGVITQNNFFTSNAAEELRRSVGPHVHKIDTFGAKRIFDEVTAYTCLLYLKSERQNQFDFRNITAKDGLTCPPSKLPTKSLDPSKWRLGSASQLRDLTRLETKGIPLGKACRIWVGIATLFDKAFTVFRVGNEWISTGPNGEQTSVESGIVKPLIRVSDLTGADSILTNQRGVMYPYSLIDGKALPLTQIQIAEQYPSALAALSKWKIKLLARDKGSVALEDWYKWGRVQSMIPVGDKLLTKTFSRGPCFYHDASDSLFSNGYALVPRTSGISLNFVRAVLNSRVFAYYAKLTSFEIEGEYQCYQKNFIERFVLPDIPLRQQESLAGCPDLEDFLVRYYGLESDITGYGFNGVVQSTVGRTLSGTHALQSDLIL